MPPKDLLWYLAEYYKFHFLGILLACLFIGIVASTVYRGTFDTMINAVFLISEPNAGALDLTPVTEGFRSHEGMGAKQLVTAEELYAQLGPDAPVSETTYATVTKLTAMIAAQEMDVFISGESAMANYAAYDAFAPLEAALPPDLLQTLSPRLLAYPGSDGVPFPCVLDISGTDFARRCNLSDGNAHLAIIVNSQRRDVCIALIRYIFENP
jgi:hypothetical protein